MPTLSENDPFSLINALQSGDKKTFAVIYQTYSKDIFIKLMKLVKSDKIAEELLQELFIKLWLKKETIDIQTNLPGYLNRMAANIAYDYFRKASREQKARAEFMQGIESTVEQDLLQEQENVLLQELDLLIDHLPPQRKRVVELCKIQGKSYQEVGNLLGISAATVNDHIVKATRTLRTQLLNKNSLSAVLFLLFYAA